MNAFSYSSWYFVYVLSVYIWIYVYAIILSKFIKKCLFFYLFICLLFYFYLFILFFFLFIFLFFFFVVSAIIWTAMITKEYNKKSILFTRHIIFVLLSADLHSVGIHPRLKSHITLLHHFIGFTYKTLNTVSLF